MTDINNEAYVLISDESCAVKKEEGPEEKGTEAEKKLQRDFLLQDVKMFMQSRTTVWEIDNP